MGFDVDILVRFWPIFLEGAWLTLRLSVVAFVLAYVLGIVVALVSLVPSRPLRLLVDVYVLTLRSIPFIIILFVVYYGLPFWGIRLPALFVGTGALALFASAYYAEIIRAGIQALPRGQYESARAVGMSPTQAMAHVVAPQIVRSLVPPSTNMTLTMIKESAVLSSITVPELTYQGLVVQGETFAPFEVFAAVTVLYWAMTSTVAHLATLFERRVGVGQARGVGGNRLAASFLVLDREEAAR